MTRLHVAHVRLNAPPTRAQMLEAHKAAERRRLEAMGLDKVLAELRRAAPPARAPAVLADDRDFAPGPAFEYAMAPLGPRRGPPAAGVGEHLSLHTMAAIGTAADFAELPADRWDQPADPTPGERDYAPMPRSPWE